MDLIHLLVASGILVNLLALSTPFKPAVNPNKSLDRLPPKYSGSAIVSR